MTWHAVAAKLALLGASAMDTTTSLHHGHELNPLISQHGEFTAQSAAVKLSVIGGLVIVQSIIEHRHPRFAKPIEITNFAAAAATGAVAISNGMRK